jgi:hypothetical protein
MIIVKGIHQAEDELKALTRTCNVKHVTLCEGNGVELENL